MDLSIGIGGVVKKVFGGLIEFMDKILFYKAYSLSTLYSGYREIFVWKPSELGGELEFRVLWRRYYYKRKLVSPMIWVKARKGHAFEKVVLLVKGEAEKIEYQDLVTLFDLSEKPVQTALGSLPFRDIRFDGRFVETPYRGIKIQLLEGLRADGSSIDCSYGHTRYVTPSDRLEVHLGREKGDIERWGEIFNLEFIEMQIRAEQDRLIGGRYGRSKFSYRSREMIFQYRFLVKLVFWLKNIVFARQIEKALEVYFSRQKALDEVEDKAAEAIDE
ncbi:hypothetical protein ACAW63_24270 [Pseudomonas sp. QE6]|uniref:hypothetical protein n=1 Tax=Pseudomonas sp. QE6 TaxID=3242491 RepID=UPI0035293A54